MVRVLPPNTKRRRAERADTDWAWALVASCAAMVLPQPDREHRFHPTRRWRFDLAWPDRMLAVEVEGGVWTRGRHTRGAGYIGDLEKYNQASLMGWRVLRFVPAQVESGEAVETIKQALAAMPGGEG